MLAALFNNKRNASNFNNPMRCYSGLVVKCLIRGRCRFHIYNETPVQYRNALLSAIYLIIKRMTLYHLGHPLVLKKGCELKDKYISSPFLFFITLYDISLRG